MTNSSSANWIYDMLLFHIVLLLWIALVWTKTTTYWVSVNIIVLRYVEVSLRSINTYLRAFVQEPCVGSPSEEDFPPHYEVHLIKALVSQCTLTVQKLVYSYSDLQLVILLSLSLQADYIYSLRNHTNTTIFFTTLNLDLNVDVFGTWYRSTLSQPFVWSLATTASASASMSAGAGGCRLWLWRAWTWTWRAFKSSWRAFWLSSILLTLRWSLRRMLWMLFRSASAVWTSDRHLSDACFNERKLVNHPHLHSSRARANHHPLLMTWPAQALFILAFDLLQYSSGRSCDGMLPAEGEIVP